MGEKKYLRGKVKLLPASRSLSGIGGVGPGCRATSAEAMIRATSQTQETGEEHSQAREEWVNNTELSRSFRSARRWRMEGTDLQTLPYPFFQIWSLFASTPQHWFAHWEMSSANAGSDQRRDVQTVTTITKAQPCSASPWESYLTNKVLKKPRYISCTSACQTRTELVGKDGLVQEAAHSAPAPSVICRQGAVTSCNFSI